MALTFEPSLLEPWRRGGPGGVAALMIDGEVVFSAAEGFADLDARRAFTADTPFHICSCTKQYTAAVLLLLEAQGRLSLDDCSTQRNLNERGVREAKRQAEVVAKLAVPVGRVLVSRYCRARDHVVWFTREFAFDDSLTPPRDAQKAKALQRLLATAPAPGTNTFFFAHGGVLWQATDYDSVEAETFVFRAGSPPTLVAAIKMEDWDALEAGRGTCCVPRTFWGSGAAPPE